MLTAAARPEDAFTLVEMLVAAVIGLIVIGMFSSMFFQAFSRAAENDVASVSAAEVTDALDRLGDDLRSARSTTRGEIAVISTRDDLKTRMIADPVLYGDVAHASGRQLAFWSDAGVAGSADPACVTYSIEQLVTEPESPWAVVRRSTPAGPCPVPAAVAGEPLARLGNEAPAADAFSYGVLEPVAPGRCKRTTVSPGAATIDPLRRLSIVSVDIDLGAIGTRRGKRRIAEGRTTIDVWSRLNDDYYYAIECAQ